jgi:hypothetical protein
MRISYIFIGITHRVQMDAGVDDHGHGVIPEERLHIAMARQ